MLTVVHSNGWWLCRFGGGWERAGSYKVIGRRQGEGDGLWSPFMQTCGVEREEGCGICVCVSACICVEMLCVRREAHRVL